MIFMDNFPFESKFVNIGGYRIHYVEHGKGKRSILLIHGNPTWSYQWRNIIPLLSSAGRCVALDLLGFGRSDKPDIEYTFEQHAEIVNGFIEKLNLKDIVMVLLDWGAAFGFWYAIEHTENVAGIAMFEPVLLTRTWDDYTGDRKKRFQKLTDKSANFELVQVRNHFIETLPERVLHKERMTKEVMNHYREPFQTVESRKAIRTFPEMLPIPENSETFSLFKKIEEGLATLTTPVLLMTANPGSSLTEKELILLKGKVHNLEILNVGAGLHHLQEDEPESISKSILNWMNNKLP